KNKVDALAPGLSTIIIASQWGTNIEARQGQPYGTLFGYGAARDSATGQVLLVDGLPQRAATKSILGNVNPEWVGGWSNDIRYKSWSLSTLIDIHHGGQNFSIGNWWGTYSGVLSNTLQGRQVDRNNQGYVAKGIDAATGKAQALAAECGARGAQPLHVDLLPELRSRELGERRQRRPGLRHGGSAHDAFLRPQYLHHSVTGNRENSLMKIIRLSAALVTIVSLTTTACSNDLTGMNANPNSPTSAPASSLFSNATETTVGRFNGSFQTLSMTSLFAQHIAQVQYVDEDRGHIRATTIDALYTGIYVNELEHFDKVSVMGQTAKTPNVWGPALVMQGWIYQNMTDLWGDIPYSEALKGDIGGGRHPPHEAQNGT